MDYHSFHVRYVHMWSDLGPNRFRFCVYCYEFNIGHWFYNDVNFLNLKKMFVSKDFLSRKMYWSSIYLANWTFLVFIGLKITDKLLNSLNK